MLWLEHGRPISCEVGGAAWSARGIVARSLWLWRLAEPRRCTGPRGLFLISWHYVAPAPAAGELGRSAARLRRIVQGMQRCWDVAGCGARLCNWARPFLKSVASGRTDALHRTAGAFPALRGMRSLRPPPPVSFTVRQRSFRRIVRRMNAGFAAIADNTGRDAMLRVAFSEGREAGPTKRCTGPRPPFLFCAAPLSLQRPRPVSFVVRQGKDPMRAVAVTCGLILFATVGSLCSGEEGGRTEQRPPLSARCYSPAAARRRRLSPRGLYQVDAKRS